MSDEPKPIYLRAATAARLWSEARRYDVAPAVLADAAIHAYLDRFDFVDALVAAKRLEQKKRGEVIAERKQEVKTYKPKGDNDVR